jgi:RNA polymerase sigma factor (sigma-70 family)
MSGTALVPILRHLRRTATAEAVPDRLLLGRFAADNDQAAFAAVVRRHARLVWCACRRVLGEAADAEDAFQATFLVLARRAGSVRWRESAGPWLYGVAHRVSLRARAAAARRRRRERQAAAPHDTARPPADLSWREACAALHEELDRLPEKFRLPLLLCYLEGKSRDEAARELGWSAGAVKGCLERGRCALRRRLERRGLAPAVGLLAAGVAVPAAGAVPRTLAATVSAACVTPATVPPRILALACGVARPVSAVRRLMLATALFAGVGLGVRAFVAAAPPPPPAAPTAKEAPPAAAAKPDAKPDGGRVVAVSGRVVGPDGKPVSGAAVYLPVLPGGAPNPWRAEEEFPEGTVCPRRATAGPDGTFRFTLPLTRGDVTVGDILAAADGYGPGYAFAGYPLPDRVADLTIRLKPDDAPVRGRLLGPEGRPAAGLKVSLLRLEEPADGDLAAYLKDYRQSPSRAAGRCYHRFADPPVVPAARVGADGRFELRGAGRGRVAVLHVEGLGVATATLRILTTPGLDVRDLPTPGRVGDNVPGWTHGPDFTHVLGPSRPVVGTARAAGTGKPVAGVRIWAHTWTSPSHAYAVTDAAGRYRLEGLPKAAKRVLHLTPPDDSPYVGAAREVPDAEGLAPQTTDFELSRGVVVTGRLTDQATGKPVWGNVEYVPLPANASFKEFPDPPGRYGSWNVAVGRDGRFRLVVLPGWGVLLAHDGDRRSRPAPPPTSTDREVLTVDAGGTFQNAYGYRATFLGVGAYRVINPARDAKALTADLDFDRGKSLAGVALDADGKPLTRAVVRGLESEGSMPEQLPAADFTVRALAPEETRTLIFRHPEHGLVAGARVRGDTPAPVRVRLRPAGSAAGRLVDAEGRPLSGYKVRYAYRDAKRQWLWNLGPHHESTGDPPWTVTDAEGRFRIDGLVPGLAPHVGILSAGKGNWWDGKWLRPAAGKEPTWEVRSGMTEELGDVVVRPGEP